MKFTSLPAAYSSFRDPLIYTFDTESDQAQDVTFSIIDRADSSVIGTKTLYGVTSGQIDIAPYLRSAAVPTLPDSIEECGEVETSTIIKVQVKAEGVTSSSRAFIAARIDQEGAYEPLMAQHLYRTLSRDEFDLISYFCFPDILVEVVVEFFGSDYESLTISPQAGGQRSIAITAKGREWCDAMKATLYVDGEATTVVEYEIKENLRASRRVAWLNRHLSPEIYTFPLRKSHLVEATRKQMESIWGKEAAALEAEGELKLISAYEPEAQIEALSEIVASPRVWLVSGCELQGVELKTERIITASDNQMGFVEVDIRSAEEGVRL